MLGILLILFPLWGYKHYSNAQQQELIQRTWASARECEGQSPELKIAPSVVQVRRGPRAGQVQGSGFIVDEGYVITATHVLVGLRGDVLVTFDNGVSKSAKWVAEERDADISLLSFEPTAFPSISLEPKWSNRTLSQKQNAVAVGWAGDTYTAFNGSVVAVQKDNAGWLKIAVAASSRLGMSGGPLVDRCGKLLGVITKGGVTASTMAVALDKAQVDRLIKFAEENRAVKPTPVPTAVPTPTQASPTPMPITPTPILPTPIPTSVVGGGSEVALRGRSEERFHAYSTGTWHKVYEYKSPRFRRMCPKSTYVARIEAAWDIWREENLQEEDVLKARVIQVEVHGNEGQVIIDWVRNGSEIFIGEYDAPYRWVFVDGRWWDEPETWQTDCS